MRTACRYIRAPHACEALPRADRPAARVDGAEIERIEHAVGPNAATVVGRMRLLLQGGKSVCLYVGATLEPCRGAALLMIHFSWVDPGDVWGAGSVLAQRARPCQTGSGSKGALG